VTTVWVICGASRGAGKTHLAQRLCEVLPDAVYIKRGHGERQNGKPSNYVTSDEQLEAFLAEQSPRHEHVVVESNAYALSGRGDVMVYLEGPAGESNRRTDCLAMRCMADLVVEKGAGEEAWRDYLWRFLGSTPLLETVLTVLREQAGHWEHPQPVVRSKVWFQVGAGHVFGPGLFRLLDGIRRYGTLQAAAEAAGVSYRFAWKQIRGAEERLGRPLVVRRRGGVRGGGTDLAPAGRHLLTVFERVNREVAAFADERFALHYGEGQEE
jgi:molybdate transport system regulatory protein